MKTRPFAFHFEVSNEFLRLSPAAAAYVDAAKRTIAAELTAVGPRGGLYRLVTPPDRWHETQNDPSAWMRNRTVFYTRRLGVYVRPDRISAALAIGRDVAHFDALTVPVVNGTAILPNGATVESQTHKAISFPVRVP